MLVIVVLTVLPTAVTLVPQDAPVGVNQLVVLAVLKTVEQFVPLVVREVVGLTVELNAEQDARILVVIVAMGAPVYVQAIAHQPVEVIAMVNVFKHVVAIVH